MAGTLPEPFASWFAARGWAPRPHQLAVLAAAEAGESVLLTAPTGGGKTLAGFLPSLVELAAAPYSGLHTLYVSPLKALAADIARNLTAPVEDMGLPVTIDTRTGDTSTARRQKQREAPPNLLLTTPESLAVLLCQPPSGLSSRTLMGLIEPALPPIASLSSSSRTVLGTGFSLCRPKLTRPEPLSERQVVSGPSFANEMVFPSLISMLDWSS